jgi:hypothetical protein
MIRLYTKAIIRNTLVMAFFFVFFLGSTFASDTLKLAYPKDTIDLGTMKQGAIKEYVFTLANHYPEKIKLFQIYPSCGCTITQEYPDSIAANSSIQVSFTFKSEGFEGLVIKNLTILTDKGAALVFYKANIKTRKKRKRNQSNKSR